MTIQNELADGLVELEADFPDTFIWDATSYKCLVSSESRNIVDSAFGAEADDMVVIIVRLELFGEGAKPIAKERLTFNNRIYTITGIDKAPNEAFAVYHCEQQR